MKAFFTLSNTGRRSRLALLPLFMGILLCIGVGQKAWGQSQTVTIGEGTGTTYYFPIDNYFNYSCTEQIYLASEIGTAGTITSISFYYNYGTSYTASNVTMYMKNVSRSSFASTADYEPLSTSDIVWTGNIAPTGSGWYTFTLNTPFQYDGTSNLLVAFYDGTSGYPGTSYTWRQTTSPSSAYMALRYYSDSYNPDPYNLGTYSGSKQTYTYRANVQIGITPSGGGGSSTTSCVEIGEGTGTTYYFPIDNYFNYSCTEQIYLPSEVGTAGTITSISFYYNYGTSYTASNVTMYMKNVSRSSFASTADYEPLSTSDIVWTGSIAPTGAGWYTFTLNTPFEYDGTSNLLVAFYDGTSGYPGTSYTWRQTTSPSSAYMALRYYSDSSNPDPYNLGTYSGSKQTYTYRANMKVCIQSSSSGGGTAPVITECLEIGDGTSTNYYPMPGFWGWQYDVYLYTPSAADFLNDNSTITSIAYNISSNSTSSGASMTVWMKDVEPSYTLSTSSTFSTFTSGATQVYNNSAFSSSSGWNTLNCSTPFQHTAGKALLVAVRGVGCSTSGGCSRNCYYTSASNTHWYKHADSSDPGSSTSGTLDANRTNIKVCAQRVIAPTSTLTTSVTPAETGTITFDPDPTYSGNRYEIGTEVELTATPEEGYSFSSWSIDGIATSITTPTITLTMDEDHSVVANFAPITYTVSVSANPAEYGTASGGGSFDYGTSCTVTATPSNASYRFANWTMNGSVVSTDANYTFTVPAQNCSLVANFVLTPYTLTTSANPNAGGTITHHSLTNPTSNTSETVEIVDESSTVNQVAFPVNFIWAYTENQMILHADEIGQAGAITSLSYQRYSEGSGSPVTRNINIYMKHTTMSAYSTTADWVAVGPADLVYSGNYTFQTSDREWQAIELNTPFNYNGTDNLLICIDDNTGTTDTRIYWWCRNTSDNRGIRAWGSSNFDPTVAGTPSGGSSLVGTFVPNMVIGFAGGGGGTGYASNEYAPNDEVEITATPNYGYTFADWTVDGTAAGSDNPTTLIMDDDHTVVANFDPIPYTVSVSSTPAEYSTASGDGVYDYGTSCTVTASTTVDCYQFVNWTLNGTVVSTQASYTFTVTADCALVAHFAIPAPASLTVSNITGSSADVSWTGNAESYDLICYPTTNPTETVYFDDINTNTISPNFNNSVTPSYPWIISSTNPHSGSYCLASGNNGVNSTTSDISMTYTFDVDGVIEFYSRVSSESSWDYGRFFIDGTQQYQESGAGSWTLRSYPVTAGTHTFLWRYYKDGSTSSNEDRYYIDDINIKFEIPTDPIVEYGVTSPYTICGLEPNTSYEVQVHGICVGENGPNSTRTFTTNNTVIPFSAGTITEGIYAPCGDITESQTIGTEIVTGETEVTVPYVTIGDENSTTTTYVTPFNSLWGYSFVEQIYTAAEIGTAGTINSISFYLSSGTQTNVVDVFMKHVSRSTFADATDYETVTSSDIVFTGSVTFNAGWTTIYFNEPFEYDGTSNLMIALHEYTSGYSTLYFNYTAATNTVITFHSDSSNPNPYSLGSYSGNKYTSANRANVRLGLPHSVIETTTLFDGTATGNGVEYQWKLDDEPIEGATSDSYTVTVAEMEGLTPSLHTYTRWVKDACNDWAQSEGEYILDLRVPGNPQITEIPTDLLCGDQATLNVTSDNSNSMQLMYYWYDEYPTPNSIEIAHSGSQYTTAPLTLGENTLYVQAVTYRVENDIDTVWQCFSEPTEVVLVASPFTVAAIAEINANYCGNYFTLQIDGNPTPNHTYVWYSDADCTHEVGRGYSYLLTERQTDTTTYWMREYAWELEGGEFLCQSSNTGSVEVPVIPLEEPYITDPSFEFCKGDPLSDIVASGDAHDDQYQLKPFIVWYTDNETQQILDTTASESPLSRLTADTSMTLYAATASYITSYSGHMPVPTNTTSQSNSGNAVFFGLTAGNSPVTLDSIDLQVPASQGVGHSVLLYYLAGALDITNTIDEYIWTPVNANMEYTGGEHAIIRLSSPMSLQPNETVSILVNTGAMLLYYSEESQIQPGESISNNDFLTISKGYGFQYNADFTSGFPTSYPQPRSLCGTVHITVEGDLEFGCYSQRDALVVVVDSVPTVGTLSAPEPLCTGGTLSEEVLNGLKPAITWNTIDEESESTGWLLSVDGNEETLVSLTPNTQFLYGHTYKLVFRATNNCGYTDATADVTVHGTPYFDADDNGISITIGQHQCAGVAISGAVMPTFHDGGNDATTGWQYSSNIPVIDNQVTDPDAQNDVTEPEWVEFTPANGIPTTGEYLIRAFITNDCGTAYTNEVPVTVGDKPTVAPVEGETVFCFGQSISFDAPEYDKNLSDVTEARWLVLVDNDDPADVTFPLTANTEWNGKRICYAVTNGCGTSYSDTVTLTVHPDINVRAASNVTLICPAVGAVLTATTDVADCTFEWSNNDEGGLMATTGNPVTAKNGTEDVNHFYTVIATDEFGCKDTAATEVAVVFHNDIYDETIEICELELPYTYTYGDQDTTLQRAGNHIVRFSQADGCDYLVNLTLATREVTVIDYHGSICAAGDTYYWDAVEGMERTYTEAASDTIHVYYTGSQCDSILYCINVTQGEPSLVITNPQLSGATGETLSTTVFGRSECDNNLKVAIEYDLYKDGELINPDDYGTLNLTTAVPDLNLQFGRNVHAASGQIPGSTFNMYNYQYGYFYLGFFSTAPNTVTATWNEPGEYKIVFRVVGRTGGMDYPYQSSPGVVIGGGGGSNTTVYATDSLIMYVSGEGGNEGQESDVNNGQNGMITVTAVQDNPVIGATSTFAVNITNPNNIAANTKVALDYEVYRDGQLLNTLDGYGTMSFATFYDVTNSMVGRTLEFPDGSLPQASFHMGFYSYGYFNLGFWAQTHNEFTANWQQPGEYKVVFRLSERTGGTPYPLTYGGSETDTVGGANGEPNGTILDTNAIVFYIPVAEPAEVDLDTTVCSINMPVTIFGHEFTDAAEEDIHVYSANGVYDTLYHVTLTVAPAYTAENPVELDSVVCAGVFPFEWNGVTFDEAGTRTATLQTALGCDSVVAMTVTVNVPAHAAYTVTACGSYTWQNGNGETYTESGDYEYSYDNDYGCTVTDTLHLTVHDVTTTPDVVTNCGPYEWNGTLYTESGTYYADREVEYDNDICTVTDTLVLTVNPVYNITDEQTLCASELPYTYGDTTFQAGTVSGTYTLRRTTAEGCDSIVTLTLTVNPSGTAVIVDNACGSYTWENGNGETYTESGTYTYEYENDFGCNATDTLLLTVHHPVGNKTEVTECGEYFWELSGETYTESGTYYADRENEDENGCIPTDTLVLTIGQPVPGTYTVVTACNSYEWNGTLYTESGLQFAYSDPDDFGCVRIDTLDLTVNPVYNVSDAQEITVTELPYAYGDTLFDLGTVSGTYTVHMSTVEGCDSIVTLTLTVTGGSVSGDAYLVVADNGDGSFDVTAFADQTDPETKVAIAYTLTKDGQPVNLVNYECGGDLYIATDYSGGNFIGQNVSYGNGYIPGSTFLMGNHYHDYFYLHFLNGRTNRIAQSFTEEGSYEITLTLMTRNDGNDIFVPYFYQGATRLVGGEGSTDGEVIATETLTFTVGGGNSNPQPQPAVSGIADSQTGSFTLFPNPARSFVTLRTNADHAECTVTDMSGRVILTTTADASQDLRINVANWAAGVYFVNLHSNGSTTSQKLVITR